jgi:hypothetical protein
MANAPQQNVPQKPTPLGNKIAVGIMLAILAVFGTLELTHGQGGRQQQAAASNHHSLHSASTTGSGG